MIQSGSFLKIIDNSGAKEACCIKVDRGYRRRYANIGDIVRVSIKSMRKKKHLKSKIKVKKGDIFDALIVKTKSGKVFAFDEKFKYHSNFAILLTAQKKLLATRVFGGINDSFKYTRFLRIVSMSSGIID